MAEIPCIYALNLWKGAPCKGLVNWSVSISPVGQCLTTIFQHALSKKGWIFLHFFFLSVHSSKWLSCPSKKIIWLLTGEVPHMLENLVMALRHLSLSIYPYVLWWNVQSSGVLKWIYWEYSLFWCKMMCGMKHFPSARVKTSNVHQNYARSPVYTFHIRSP